MSRKSTTLSSPPRTVTEFDINMFANTFLNPSVMGREKEAHATMILAIVDALHMQTMGIDDELAETRRDLVGEKNATNIVSLGWSNLRLYKPLRAGDTVTVKSHIASSRISRSRPDMVIFNMDVASYDQNGKKISDADHVLATW